MLSEIVLINRNASQNDPLKLDVKSGADWLTWNTCVRQMAFGTIHWLDVAHSQGLLKPTDQIFVGAEAYRYCLEVICGLHSPMLGETEVGGQFKLAFAQRTLTDVQKAVGFHKFFQSIFADFKEVRSRFLVNLGSSSYGSLTRKYLSGFSHVHILGAGHLAKEMLPWLVKNREEVVIHSRREEPALELKQEFSSLIIKKYHQPSDEFINTGAVCGAVVIAAPIKAAEISKWISLHDEGVELIIDLRSEAHEDLIQTRAKVIRLDELFKQVEQVQQEVQAKVQNAQQYISSISLSRVTTTDHRPYGWDDLCV